RRRSPGDRPLLRGSGAGWALPRGGPGDENQAPTVQRPRGSGNGSPRYRLRERDHQRRTGGRATYAARLATERVGPADDSRVSRRLKALAATRPHGRGLAAPSRLLVRDQERAGTSRSLLVLA